MIFSLVYCVAALLAWYMLGWIEASARCLPSSADARPFVVKLCSTVRVILTVLFVMLAVIVLFL